MPWQVLIRMIGESDWYSIWSAAGALAERDARARFEQVRSAVASQGASEPNVHASRWSAVRLTHADEIIEEFPRGGATAKHTMP
jgi:hypothetical protein